MHKPLVHSAYMTAKQWRMKQAMHTETPSGLTAAWNRGKNLADSGGSELQMRDAMERCESQAAACHLRAGFEAALLKAYKL
jgi:hypothetical protein